MNYPKFLSDNIMYCYKIINAEETLQINFVQSSFSISIVSTDEALGYNQTTEITEAAFYEIFDTVFLHLNEVLSNENKYYQVQKDSLCKISSGGTIPGDHIKSNIIAINATPEAVKPDLNNTYKNFVDWNFEQKENKQILLILILIIFGFIVSAFACIGFYKTFFSSDQILFKDNILSLI